MSKNIVVLSGSTRKGDSADRLTAIFEEGAKSVPRAKKEVTVFRTMDMNIAMCTGGDICYDKETAGECHIKDDMYKIYDALRQADALIIVSPVHFFGVTRNLKNAIGRTYAMHSDGLNLRCGLLLTCGGAKVSVMDDSIAFYNKLLAFHNWEDAGRVAIGGLREDTSINGRKELAQVRLLGKDI